MSFRIMFSKEARDLIKKLDNSGKIKLEKRLLKLSEAPFHYGKRLKSVEELFSLKVGKSGLRVIFEINRKTKTVFVITLGPRETIYQKID